MSPCRKGNSGGPDGTQIAFTITQAGRQTLAIIRKDGGTPKSLDLMPAGTRFPSWAPDGKSQLFHRMQTSQDPFAIYSLELASGHATEMPGSRGLTDPVFSPDGSYVAAQADDDDRKLMLFDFQTRQWTHLVTAHTLFGVYWSRDGSWLYYQDVFGGVEQPIYRIHIPDRRVERVTTTAHSCVATFEITRSRPWLPTIRPSSAWRAPLPTFMP